LPEDIVKRNFIKHQIALFQNLIITIDYQLIKSQILKENKIREKQLLCEFNLDEKSFESAQKLELQYSTICRVSSSGMYNNCFFPSSLKI
jgi:hypothetical protein